ncbi:hypothetical protein HS99_0017140 [Kitasatospora aureofaciens]|uniref:Peptidase inhibitor n=1 Tax=Kitasatospora aureofaciens TaxID=1894 RepID=A0A1E7MVG4_KITAU|nr:hypothetical protein [Kitasatospora aureofaciens]OEV32415.1 hypothetical protein HS99_0017140 [Kitasatospora aureofaciens]
MRRTTHALAALTVAAAALTAVATGNAGAADGSWAGCPYGAVCVYPQDQNPASSPSAVYWSYGAHNLNGQYGNHWVLNNQSAGAHAHLCQSYNGANCVYDIPAQNGVYYNLGPINSITLDHP